MGMKTSEMTVSRGVADRKSGNFTQYKFRLIIQRALDPATILAKAATTGKLALLDDDGNDTGEYDVITGSERLHVLELLLSKLVAAPKSVLAAPGDASMGLAEDVAKASAALFIEQAEKQQQLTAKQAEAITVAPLPAETTPKPTPNHTPTDC